MHRRLLLLPIAVVAVASLFVTSVAEATSGGSSGGKGSSGGTSSSGRRTHIVAKGDTVPSVARRYGVSADDIRAANGIVDDRLYLGAQLVIDGSAAADDTSSSSTSSSSTPSSRASSDTATVKTTRISSSTYKVRKGDALVRIARKHGVSLKALLAANDLTADSLIVPGDKLVIPSGSGTTTTKDSSPSGSSTGRTATSSTRSAGSTGPDLRCPVAGASFMNDWGFPRDGGTRFHEGTDMFAPKGTTIVAPASGTVVYGSNNLGGTTFTLTTDTGWVIYGAHLSATIGSSRRVAAGQAIARVGNSGDALGGDTHLHIGIKRVGGQPQNPYPAVLRACR